MKRVKLKEMIKPKGWDSYDLENSSFINAFENADNVSRDRFENFVLLDDNVTFVHEEGQDLEDWIAYSEKCGDLKYQVSLYKGHVIACINNMGSPIYFTPSGVLPTKIPDLTKTPTSLVKYVLDDAFDLTADDIPGKLVVHGSGISGVNNVMENGISEDFLLKGYLGKCFYTSTNYKVSLSNYANNIDPSPDKTESGLVLLQIKASANIIGETDPLFDELQDKMGQDNFLEIAEELGVDGIFVNAYDAIGIYNPDAVKILNSFITKDVLAAHKKRLVELDDNLSF